MLSIWTLRDYHHRLIHRVLIANRWAQKPYFSILVQAKVTSIHPSGHHQITEAVLASRRYQGLQEASRPTVLLSMSGLRWLGRVHILQAAANGSYVHWAGAVYGTRSCFWHLCNI